MKLIKIQSFIRSVFRAEILKRSYFLLGFLFIFFMNCIATKNMDLGGVYDSYNYWHIFDSLFFDGKINFNVEVWRGYVFPLYLMMLNKCAGGGYGCFIVANSLINSLMFMYFIPMLHNFSGGFSIKSSALCVANWLLVFFLFSGLYLYTLSDAYALNMCLLSVFFLMRFRRVNNYLKSLLSIFLCGVFVYFAYNIRTIYLFGGVLCLLSAIYFSIKKYSNKAKSTICVAILFLGVLFSALPQMVLNYKAKGKKSIFVPTQSLMLSQCFWGVQFQRYDTYVGSSAHAPEQEIPQMHFPDPVGQRLLEREQIKRFDSWKHFFKFICRYPFEVAGIYVRHLASGLFPCWPSMYVEKINNNKLLYLCLALLLIYSFCLSLVFKCVIDGTVLFRYLPSLVTCLFILPGSMEIRFLLAVFLMMSSNLFFNTDFKKLYSVLKTNAVSVLIIFVFFCALMISQWTMFLMSEPKIPIFILGAP